MKVEEISSRYAVIVNPYGEGYPEQDAVTLRTFSSIEDYVYNGGIFVSIGGYPFYWALDVASGDKIAMAKPFGDAFHGKMDSKTGEVFLQKVIDRKMASLFDYTLDQVQINGDLGV
jgi:hypothetical protein